MISFYSIGVYSLGQELRKPGEGGSLTFNNVQPQHGTRYKQINGVVETRGIFVNERERRNERQRKSDIKAVCKTERERSAASVLYLARTGGAKWVRVRRSEVPIRWKTSAPHTKSQEYKNSAARMGSRAGGGREGDAEYIIKAACNLLTFLFSW